MTPPPDNSLTPDEYDELQAGSPPPDSGQERPEYGSLFRGIPSGVAPPDSGQPRYPDDVGADQPDAPLVLEPDSLPPPDSRQDEDGYEYDEELGPMR